MFGPFAVPTGTRRADTQIRPYDLSLSPSPNRGGTQSVPFPLDGGTLGWGDAPCVPTYHHPKSARRDLGKLSVHTFDVVPHGLFRRLGSARVNRGKYGLVRAQRPEGPFRGL